MNRKSAKSLFLGGNMHLKSCLQRSVLVAGDLVRVDVELINNSTSRPDYLMVSLKQELKLITNEKKKVTHVSGTNTVDCLFIFVLILFVLIERVHSEKIVEPIPTNDTWLKTVEFKIPGLVRFDSIFLRQITKILSMMMMRKRVCQ